MTDNYTDLREQIADILRTGHYRISETKVANSLLALITQRETAARIKALEELPITQIVAERGDKRDVVYFHDVITAIGINKTILELKTLKPEESWE